MAGSVRVQGNASECAGSSSHGGTIIIEGDASSRAGISLKGGTILVAGERRPHERVHGPGRGHAHRRRRRRTRWATRSTRRSSTWPGRSPRSAPTPGSRSSPTPTSASSRTLAELGGFDHIQPENVTRVASAREALQLRRPEGPEVLMDEDPQRAVGRAPPQPQLPARGDRADPAHRGRGALRDPRLGRQARRAHLRRPAVPDRLADPVPAGGLPGEVRHDHRAGRPVRQSKPIGAGHPGHDRRA